MLLLLSRFSRVPDSVRPHTWQPTRRPRPWDSPGKNTGVGCHFLLQCMKVKVKVKSLSHVRFLVTRWTAAYQAPPSKGFSRQEYWSGLCLILWDPMDCSPPASSAHRIFQARILEWVAISFSRGSSWPRDQTHITCLFCIDRRILYHCTTWEAPDT